MTNVKTCTKCNEAKSLDQFGKDKSNKSGLTSACKACRKITTNAWRGANGERVKQVSKAWRVENPEYQRDWVKANPIYSAALDGKNNAVRRAPDCVPDDFNFEATLPIFAERIRLTEETGVEHHIDHIIPIAAGGAHTADNLQVLTAEQNRQKRTTDKEIYG